jgi:hypothetical protein
MREEGYRTQSADTSPEAERFIIERLRELPIWRKAEMITAITRAAEEMSLAGLRARYPEAQDDELRLRLAALRLDRDTMVRLFGWDPVEKGY